MRRVMSCLFAVWILVAETGSVLAIGNAGVGENHYLMGLTVIQVRIESSDEVIRIAVNSEDEQVFYLVVTDPAETETMLELEPAVDGWLDDTGLSTLDIPASAGIWTLSFDFPSELQSQNLNFEIDVIDARFGSVVPGRIFSKRWQFNAGSYDNQTTATFYVVATADPLYTIWQVAFDGLAGWEFQLQANRIGPSAPASGRSAPMSGIEIGAEYDVYLDIPDLPIIAPESSEIDGIELTFTELLVATEVRGTLHLWLDLDDDGVFSIANGEAVLVREVAAGLNELPWDGRDGHGYTIPDGEYLARAELMRDEIHITAIDIEHCRPGLRIFRLGATGPQSTNMQWDDTLIDDGTLELPATPPNGLPSGHPDQDFILGENSHGWGGPLGSAGGPGDRSFIDTSTWSLFSRSDWMVSLSNTYDLPIDNTDQGYSSDRDAGVESTDIGDGRDSGGRDRGYDLSEPGLDGGEHQPDHDSGPRDSGDFADERDASRSRRPDYRSTLATPTSRYGADIAQLDGVGPLNDLSGDTQIELSGNDMDRSQPPGCTTMPDQRRSPAALALLLLLYTLLRIVLLEN